MRKVYFHNKFFKNLDADRDKVMKAFYQRFTQSLTKKYSDCYFISIINERNVTSSSSYLILYLTGGKLIHRKVDLSYKATTSSYELTVFKDGVNRVKNLEPDQLKEFYNNVDKQFSLCPEFKRAEMYEGLALYARESMVP